MVMVVVGVVKGVSYSSIAHCENLTVLHPSYKF